MVTVKRAGEEVCLCELLNTLIGSEMEKNKHQPPPSTHIHTQTFSLSSSVSTSAMCFLNPAMLVKAWGRFFRCSYPITVVLSQMLRARWVSLSAAYGVDCYAIRTVPLDPRRRCLLEGVGVKHT